MIDQAAAVGFRQIQSVLSAAGIAWRDPDLFQLAAPLQGPAEGVFPTAASHDENPLEIGQRL